MSSFSSCFSPRNGEVILKVEAAEVKAFMHGFSPRNGEVILKSSKILSFNFSYVSVPAMGK